MILKRALLILLATVLLCSSAWAQDSEQGATEIQISQTYPSKTLGNLMLPFGWNAEAIDSLKRLVATEPNTAAPAILTVDLVDDLPKDIDLAELAQSVASAMAESIGATAEMQAEEIQYDCGQKKCPSLTVYRTSFKGIEKSVQRQCAIEIVPVQGRMIVLTMCGVTSKLYRPEFGEVLNQVFASMK